MKMKRKVFVRECFDQYVTKEGKINAKKGRVASPIAIYLLYIYIEREVK